MTAAVERLKTEIVQRSPEDRAALAQFLMRTLDTETDDDAETAWRAELQRRDEEIDAGRARGKPASQVIEELQRKYS